MTWRALYVIVVNFEYDVYRNKYNILKLSKLSIEFKFYFIRNGM